MSNRRRTSANRARAHPAPQARRRSRPFGGRPRGGVRSYAVLRRLHAMPRWAVPLATVVLVLVGLYAGSLVGGLSLLAVLAFLGWLAYLAWPQLGWGGRAVRGVVLGMVGGVAMARLFGVWG